MGLTLANLLTVLRLALVPFFIIAVTDTRFGLALAIFAVAGATDFLDGIIARMWKQATPLGAILDPMADKLLLTAAFVVLCLPDHPKSLPDFSLLYRLPIALVILSISRDVIIALIAGVLYVTGVRQAFTPTILGKATTAVQILTVLAVLLSNWAGREAPLPGSVGLMVWATYALVLASGLHYIFHAIHGSRVAGEGAGGR